MAEVLGTCAIDELVQFVESTPDPTAQLEADRDRLRGEVDNLVQSIAQGVPALSVAPTIRQKEAEIARIEVKLRQQRPVKPDVSDLRAALEQRSADWKAQLRAHPKEARLLLRRLVGPLVLHDDADRPEWVAQTKPEALLEGIANTSLASPTGQPVLYLEGPLAA